MYPEFFTLPVVGYTIKTYGFCLMVGFLSAVWLGMRRAERSGASPDVFLDMSFLTLIFGVSGARLFFVVHYWDEQFAGAANQFVAIIDITQGGLEVFGGFLCAVLAACTYAVVKKVSLRLYLDILAPSYMWGLAFGRIGCFFNGCCFGSLCVVPGTYQAAYPWAVEFPFASPAQWRQWEDRDLSVPAELMVSAKGMMQPALLPADQLFMSIDRRNSANLELERVRAQLGAAQSSGADATLVRDLEAAFKQAEARKQASDRKLSALHRAQGFPSRASPTRRTSVSELEELAKQYRSHPVHPTQLYSAIHAIILSGLLSALFLVRRRHGVVIGALIVLYPIPRILLELIRADNPHDVAGLTVSQFVSLALLLFGVFYLWVIFKKLPEQSPTVALEKARAEAAT